MQLTTAGASTIPMPDRVVGVRVWAFSMGIRLGAGALSRSTIERRIVANAMCRSSHTPVLVTQPLESALGRPEDGGMWVECFERDARFDGDAHDPLAEKLLEHVRATHDVPYPDDEIRLWARNFAEASVREDGPTQRLPSIGTIEVHPVTEERIDDWLRFFDRDAFPDNPDWGSCYCLHPHTGDVPERPWRDVRAEMVGRLRSGATLGYLAYVDGRPAGWVNASYRSTYAKYDGIDPGGPAADTILGVSCFVIAPPYRRHGVSSALLDRVIDDGGSRGALYVEGYPRTAEGGDDASSFCGPRSMFNARSFSPAEEHERFTVVRRPVESDDASLR